jgi:hypothetical protein
LLPTPARFAISPFALFAAMGVAASPGAGYASPLAPIPRGATLVEAHRYRSPLSYRATLAWYEKQHGAGGHRLRFETLVDLPDVVSAHAAQTNPEYPYTGLNVSEFDGGVWIFIMAR